jgi:hypothetical protein
VLPDPFFTPLVARVEQGIRLGVHLRGVVEPESSGGFVSVRIVGADVARVEPAAAPAPAPGSRPRPRPRRASTPSHRIDASRARAGWVAAPVTVAAAVALGAPAATAGTLAVPVALGARGRRPDLGPHAAEPRQP